MSSSPSFSLFQNRPAGSCPEPTLGGALRLAVVQLYSLREYVVNLDLTALARNELLTLQAHLECTLGAALEQLDGIAATLAEDTAAKPLPRRETMSEHVRIRETLECLYRAYEELEELSRNRRGGKKYE
jgi:hypothetical protein